MLRFLSLGAVAAVAMAQNVDLTTRQNDLVARRQTDQSASVFELSQQVSTIMENLNNGVPNDIISRISTDTIARTIEVTNAQAVMEATLGAELDQVRADASTNAATASVAAAAGASAVAAMQTFMVQQTASMNAAMEAQTAATSTTLSRAMAAMDSTLGLQLTQAQSTATAQASGVTAAISSLNSTLTSSLASVRPIAGHGWRGGCSQRKNGGWNWMCFDRTTYDTAAPYFRKSSNTRFSSLRNVFLHINFFSIGTSCGWQYHFLYVNGAVWSSAHGHAFYSHWKDSHVIDTLKIPTGHWVGLQSHAACGHVAIHEYGSTGRWGNFALNWKGNY